MAVQGISARDFFDLARWSWQVYENVKAAKSNFSNLGSDVECLLISVGSLDKGHTHQLVQDYIDDDDEDSPRMHHHGMEGMTSRQVEVMALRDGLNSVIVPFLAVFEKHQPSFARSGKPKKPPKDNPYATGNDSLRPLDKSPFMKFGVGPTVMPEPAKSEDWFLKKMPMWIRKTVAAFELKDLNELRSRFAVQAANLNLFMTRLTHLQIQRQTMLITLRLTEQSLLGDNWRYSQDLVAGKSKFRMDVAAYVQHLLDGGPALEEKTLRQMRSAHRHRSKSATKESANSMYEERLAVRTPRVQGITTHTPMESTEDQVTERQAISYRSYPQLAVLNQRRQALENQIDECVKGTGRAEIMSEAERDTRLRKAEHDLIVIDNQRSEIIDDALRRADLVRRQKMDVNRKKETITRKEMEQHERMEIEDRAHPGNPAQVSSAAGRSHPIELRRVEVSDRSRSRSRSRGRSRSRSRNEEADKILQRARRRLAKAEQQGLLEGNDSEDDSEESDWLEEPASESLLKSDSLSQAVPMASDHILGARPTASTDRKLSTDGGESDENRKQRKPMVLVCDECDERIEGDEEYFMCSTGNCASEEGESFDLCLSCFGRGHRCRGRARGTCPPMKSSKLVIKRSPDYGSAVRGQRRAQR